LKKLLLLLLVFALFSCRPKKDALRPLAPLEPKPSAEKKIGLALGGGSARGFSEIGVLRVFEQEKIPISFIAGTSVGSLIGALYCDTGKVVDLEYHAVTIGQEDIFDYSLFSLLSGGLVKGEKLEDFLRKNMRHTVLEDLAIPLTVVATDLRTGERVGFETGSVAIAVHASCAIPGIFQPVQIGNRVFVDGGVSDPVPVDFVREKGADIVIAVAIPPDIPPDAPDRTAEIVRHSVNIMFSKISDCTINDADVIIKPKCGTVRFNDFVKRRELIMAGEEAAREALPKIRELLNGEPK
jgi:NTE family protein